MNKDDCEKGPQAGLQEEESRTLASAGGSPTYSGVGNNRLVGRQTVDLREHDHGTTNLDLDDTASDKDLDDTEEEACDPKSYASTSDVGFVVKIGASGKGRRKRKILASGPGTEQGHPPAKVTTARRGRASRGSAITRARAELKKMEYETREREFEKALHARAYKKAVPKPILHSENSEEIAENTQRLRETAAEECRPDDARKTGDDIIETVRKAAIKVIEETGKSKNLNGQVHGRIKAACLEITKAMDELATREESDELRALKADNKRMREQLAHLQTETKALRTAFSERRNPTQASPPGEHPEAVKDILKEFKEELKNELLRTLGEIINVRIGEIASRLPPGPILRPPLAADKNRPFSGTRQHEGVAPEINSTPPTLNTTRVANGDKAAPAENRQTSTGATLMPPARPGPATVQKYKRVTVERESSRPNQPSPPPPAEEQWNNVTGKKAKRKANKPSPRASNKTAPKPTPGQKKLAIPKTAAVVVALKPESKLTYADIMSKATTSFRLEELGLEHVSIRKTADGARIIEVPGADSGRTADALRDKMELIIGGDARVYRPIKMGKIRISGLDETVTTEEVGKVVAEKGNCLVEQVKVGDIKMGPLGTGATLVQCPITAVNTLIAARRLLVGWSAAQVRALAPEPLRCYKCMGTGHTRALCPSLVDRGDLCYRCSKPGHQMKNCTATPFCAVCHHAKRSAEHTMGGHTCNPPKIRGVDVAARTPAANKEGINDADNIMET
ncbi:uncharacterized protein LOC134658616 [Cydia amplana]|uniref:uncharacterized protein LOC134658616 n=1 Tax=Cydia amplana TaxID=1869771 RepID=UPI002FE529F9